MELTKKVGYGKGIQRGSFGDKRLYLDYISVDIPGCDSEQEAKEAVFGTTDSSL